MKILLTGATSFTGYWFCKALSKSGHDVVTFIRQKPEAYSDIRLERLKEVVQLSLPVYDVTFGSDSFFEALQKLPSVDIFCHHAADVTDYKNPQFDAIEALRKNTYRLPEVLEKLKEKGCRTLVLTGSVFEQGEGAGSDNLRAVSPYGLSKGMTADYFTYYTAKFGIKLKKFVIPNPFGPYEEVRFTTFLAKTWLEDKIAPVTMPNYVRDNIPVSLLAKAYAAFCFNNDTKYNPSGFVESQGEFTARFQVEMKKRLQRGCAFEIKTQTDFSEPLIRYNLDPVDGEALDWDEIEFWDELAAFYEKTYAR